MMDVSKKSVLDDHKRKGSKFIPPVMQLPGGISEINYIKQILPHIIWMGLVNDRLGYKKGIEVNKTICEIAFKLKSTENYVNFAVVGNFAVLSVSEKMNLVEILSSNSTLQIYQECLAPLIALYDDFPLSFLGQADEIASRTQLIATLRGSVKRHFNKYKNAATLIQANVIYIRGITGGLQISNTIEPPDLNAIIERPESDAGKKAAGFVRATVMSEINAVESVSLEDWARSFWNAGYRHDKCDFSWERK